MIGSINTHHAWVEYFASKLQMKIYSLNYRLAPVPIYNLENKFSSAT